VLYWYADINFLHFAVLLFVICVAVLVAVSLATPEQSREQLAGLTFATAAPDVDPSDRRLASNPHWRRMDVVLSALLVLAVVLIWLSFRG
jgi:SSS family solute:Na+ symporter